MGTADPSSRGRVHNGGLLLKIFGFGALLLAVAGCNATTCSTAIAKLPVAVVPADVGPATTAKLQDPDDVKYYRSDEPLRMAIEHFNRGHYGIAERYFRDATEKAPKDPTAWIGLAAAYDRIATLRSCRSRLCLRYQACGGDHGDPQQPGLLVHATG